MALICRTCLLENEGNELESIYERKIILTENKTLSEMVSLCTGIEISKHDQFSDQICQKCISDVIIAYKYRKQCWDSQKILLELQAQEVEHHSALIDLSDNDNNSISGNDVSLKQKIENIYVPDPEHQNYSNMSLNITTLPKMHLDLIHYMKKSEEDSANGRPIVCALCSTSYKGIGHLRSHLGKVHKLNDITRFKCNVCEKKFSSEHILKMHFKIHTADTIKEVCQYCGKTFDRARLLEIHLRRHRGDKPFLCDQCDFRTYTASELSTHKRSHTGDKPFKCHLCPAAYKTPSHRANHIRSHSNERPYKCILCLTSYKTRNTYRNHMNLHNPDKSVKCEICTRTFKSRRNLRVHMAQHGEKRFQCTICENKSFYLKSGLQYHMKIVHRIVEKETICKFNVS